MKSEYESKYGRMLWDKETRSNYFQLVKERKHRMWVSANHTPIQWEQNPNSVRKDDHNSVSILKNRSGEKKDEEGIKSETKNAEDVLAKASESLKVTNSSDGNCSCSTQSCCLQRIKTHMNDVINIQNQGYSLHIELNPTRQTKQQDFSKNSKCRPKSSTSMPKKQQRHTKHKIPPELPKSIVPKDMKSQSITERPLLAPPSPVIHMTNKDKEQPPFAIYGRNTSNTKQTFNVQPKKEVYSSALKAKHEREKLRINKRKAAAVKQARIPMKLFGEALLTYNKTNKSGLWETEYQRNYKPFV